MRLVIRTTTFPVFFPKRFVSLLCVVCQLLVPLELVHVCGRVLAAEEASPLLAPRHAAAEPIVKVNDESSVLGDKYSSLTN